MSKCNRLIFELDRLLNANPARSEGILNNDPWVGVLGTTPIVPGSVQVAFDETPSTTSRTGTDTDNGDGTGTISGTQVSGTIDYITGRVTLNADAGGESVLDSSVDIDYLAGSGNVADEVEGLLAAEGADIVSRTIYPNRLQDETGLFQVEIDAPNDTPKMVLYGRADSGAPWFNIQEYVNSDMDSNDTAVAVVAIFPHMRVVVEGLGVINITKMSAWLVE